MSKRCQSCGFRYENILATLIDAAEERVLCPNCYTAAVANGRLEFEADQNLIDDITGEPGAVKFRSTFENYTLAPQTMLRLLARNLRPDEWKALVTKYSEHNFLLHDDFYTPDGVAWQPVV